MILEGIVTTLNSDSSVNISPMGPEVTADFRQFVLKPFQTSQTLQNLLRIGCGVLHVTDNVRMLAAAAIGDISPVPATRPVSGMKGVILEDACRWYAFRVVDLDHVEPPAAESRRRLVCEVVSSGRLRDFFGLNRAKHAVVEASILATRVHLLDPAEILRQLETLQVLVDKTGGEDEREAMAMLRQYVDREVTGS